jgi:hypothetical protein
MDFIQDGHWFSAPGITFPESYRRRFLGQAQAFFQSGFPIPFALPQG